MQTVTDDDSIDNSSSISSASVRRATNALLGLALGDALGMPTQSMSPEDIDTTYGRITDFEAGAACQPIAPNLPAATITDDTEQAMLLAGLLIGGNGHIDPMAFARALLNWEDDMIQRGSRDLLGPSTKLALEAVRNGADPQSTGKTGTTNGAAMRVAPVGIAFDISDTQRFAQAVHESIMVTHDTVPGWQAAALVAAAVSAGVSGSTTHDAIAQAIDWVATQPTYGHWSPKASVLARTQTVLHEIQSIAKPEIKQYIRSLVGTSVESNESIPAAFAIAYTWASEPFEGLCVAANLGGDTDTIGAIAGAILGATAADSDSKAYPQNRWPADKVAQVVQRNHLHIEPLVQQLLHIRTSSHHHNSVTQ